MTINLTRLLKKFSSGWVAITPDYKSVVTSGRTLKEVTNRVKKMERDDAILMSVSKNYRGSVTAITLAHN